MSKGKEKKETSKDSKFAAKRAFRKKKNLLQLTREWNAQTRRSIASGERPAREREKTETGGRLNFPWGALKECVRL